MKKRILTLITSLFIATSSLCDVSGARIINGVKPYEVKNNVFTKFSKKDNCKKLLIKTLKIKENFKKEFDKKKIETNIKKKKENKKENKKKEEKKFIDMFIPKHSSFKSYMPYTAITSKSSKQYKLQQKAYSDKNGLRKYDKYYLVAMGQYYGKVGDKFKVTLSSGQVFYAMIGDTKQYRHTGKGNGMVGADNKDMFEFIVDYRNLNKEIRRSGSVNTVLKGKVVRLQKERG